MYLVQHLREVFQTLESYQIVRAYIRCQMAVICVRAFFKHLNSARNVLHSGSTDNALRVLYNTLLSKTIAQLELTMTVSYST